jgi:hypothetical protein
MPKAKKSKLIVREIKSNIKVTEIKKEEPAELEQEEPSLEDIAETGPSARVFPAFEQQETVQQTPEIPVSEQTTQENRAPIYQVQANVTEKEIRQKYETSKSRFGEGRAPILGIAPGMERREALGNRELAAARPVNEEDEKYSISTEPQQKKETRRYPWEA